MKFVVPVLLSLSLVACSTADVETSTTRSSENVVTVMPGTYAMASPATPETMAPNQQRLTSSECAKNFDSTISYLEYLMEQRQQQQAKSAL